MDKYLIVGLGNPGTEYASTRHNAGYMVLDAFARASNTIFSDRRYGFMAETSVKGRKLFLLKPTTFMNLSGNAVRFWLNKENIDESRLLVIVDDIALPLGTMRLKAGGSNGGHNGLGHIQQLIGQQYARLRIGIGHGFAQGGQIDYVLGNFAEDELARLAEVATTACDAVRAFVLEGVERTMNRYNTKPKKQDKAEEAATLPAERQKGDQQ